MPEFEAKNCAVIGCSNDGVDKNKEFAEQQGFKYPLLCDTDLAVSVAYGAAADTTASSAARIAALIGTDGNVKQLWNPAGKGEFPAVVLEAL